MAERKELEQQEPHFGRLEDLDEMRELPPGLRTHGRDGPAILAEPELPVAAALTNRATMTTAEAQVHPEIPGQPGESVRATRLAREVDIEVLAQRTRFSRRILEDVEANRFDQMPPAYVRGYLRAIARELDCDPGTWITAYENLGYAEPVLKATVQGKPNAPKGGRRGRAKYVVVSLVLASGLGLGLWAWNSDSVRNAVSGVPDLSLPNLNLPTIAWPEIGIPWDFFSRENGSGWWPFSRGIDEPEVASVESLPRAVSTDRDAEQDRVSVAALPTGTLTPGALTPGALTPGTEVVIPEPLTLDPLPAVVPAAPPMAAPLVPDPDSPAVAPALTLPSEPATVVRGQEQRVATEVPTPATFVPVVPAEAAEPAGAAETAGTGAPALATLPPGAAEADSTPAITVTGAAPGAAPGVISESGVVAAAPTGTEVVLNFTGTSWVELRTANDRIELTGVFHSGDRRALRVELPVRIVLGNAPVVQLTRDGRVVDLSPLTRTDNTARITLAPLP